MSSVSAFKVKGQGQRSEVKYAQFYCTYRSNYDTSSHTTALKSDQIIDHLLIEKNTKIAVKIKKSKSDNHHRNPVTSTVNRNTYSHQVKYRFLSYFVRTDTNKQTDSKQNPLRSA